MKWMKQYWRRVVIILIVVGSFALGLHNASIYSPNHGFDGSGHVCYVNYVAKHWKMPPAASGWETHQPPLYYFIGAAVMTLFGNFRAVHYINIFILWGIIGMVGLGLKALFKDKDQILLGMLSLAALPMLNIFPAMITNELLNTFFIITTAVALIYFVKAKKKNDLTHSGVRIALGLILGIWTKISIITILPTTALAFGISLFRNKKQRVQIFLIGLATLILFAAAAVPLFMRGAETKGPSNVGNTMRSIKADRPLNWYVRLDWIWKVDMYNTQYYSMLGAAWNSFFSDGHNAITPFVKFHKKAFILWSLGFILLPLSLFGLIRLWRMNRDIALIVYAINASMLGMYLLYNLGNYYSAARLTYEMAIVIPYSFGLAGAAINKKMKTGIFALLCIQFVILISFYWILPWWFVTKYIPL